MSKVERRDITVRKWKIENVLIEDFMDSEIDAIVEMMNADMEDESSRRNINSTVHLFAYIALKYAMRLYQIENQEKVRQRNEEKRLDETIKMLKNFLKKP